MNECSCVPSKYVQNQTVGQIWFASHLLVDPSPNLFILEKRKNQGQIYLVAYLTKVPKNSIRAQVAAKVACILMKLLLFLLHHHYVNKQKNGLCVLASRLLLHCRLRNCHCQIQIFAHLIIIF